MLNIQGQIPFEAEQCTPYEPKQEEVQSQSKISGYNLKVNELSSSIEELQTLGIRLGRDRSKVGELLSTVEAANVKTSLIYSRLYFIEHCFSLLVCINNYSPIINYPQFLNIRDYLYMGYRALFTRATSIALLLDQISGREHINRRKKDISRQQSLDLLNEINQGLDIEILHIILSTILKEISIWARKHEEAAAAMDGTDNYMFFLTVENLKYMINVLEREREAIGSKKTQTTVVDMALSKKEILQQLTELRKRLIRARIPNTVKKEKKISFLSPYSYKYKDEDYWRGLEVLLSSLWESLGVKSSQAYDLMINDGKYWEQDQQFLDNEIATLRNRLDALQKIIRDVEPVSPGKIEKQLNEVENHVEWTRKEIIARLMHIDQGRQEVIHAARTTVKLLQYPPLIIEPERIQGVSLLDILDLPDVASKLGKRTWWRIEKEPHIIKNIEKLIACEEKRAKERKIIEIEHMSSDSSNNHTRALIKRKHMMKTSVMCPLEKTSLPPRMHHIYNFRQKEKKE